jgi:hypothetical protein
MVIQNIQAVAVNGYPILSRLVLLQDRIGTQKVRQFTIMGVQK